MNLAERLFELRRRAGLSQEELANEIGVSRQAVGKWENGSSVPELEKLLTLCDFYHISIGGLLGSEASEAGAQSGDAEGGQAQVVDIAPIEALLRELSEQQTEGELRSKRQRRRLWMVLGAAGVAIVALAVIAGVKFSRLESYIGSLNQLVVFTQNSLSQRIGVMQNSITGLLEDQNSLFESWDVRAEGYEPENRELALRITVTPKTVPEAVDVVFLLRDENGGEYSVEAQTEGSAFTAEIDVPVEGRPEETWLKLQRPQVEHEAAANTWAESLNVSTELEYTLTVVFSDGERTWQQEAGSFYAGIRDLAADPSFQWYADGAAGLLAIYAPSDRDIVSAQLVALVNGQEAGRTDIDLDSGWCDTFDMPEKYLDVRENSRGEVYSVPAMLSNPAGRLFVRELALDVPDHGQSDRVSFLLELTDGVGITYAGLVLDSADGEFDIDTYGDLEPVVK